MNHDTLTIVLAGGVGSRLHPLTADRAKPSVPFAGKYRIIDFALSNCLHSGLRKIMVLTQYKSHSLFKHLRDGWSVFNPQIGEYLSVIPPQMRTGESWYSGTADAVFQNLYLLKRSGAKNVLILSGDHIYRMDYAAMLEFHEANSAIATIACMKVPLVDAGAFGVVAVDEKSQVTKFVEKPKRPFSIPNEPDQALASMGIYAFSLEFLCQALEADAASDESTHDFGKDILPRLIRTNHVFGYQFGGDSGRVTADGYWRDVGTLDSYYEANMDMLLQNPPLDLYQPNWPIHGDSKQGPPARVQVVTKGEKVINSECENVMMGPGTVISGARISNSILGSNVRIGANAVVKDSIIFDNVEVGEGVSLQRCVVDKGVQIPSLTRVGIDNFVDAKRFVVSDQGVVVIPREYSFENRTAPTKPTRPYDPPIRIGGKPLSVLVDE